MSNPAPHPTDGHGRQIPHLPAGTYQHYKGDLYQVLGLGHDANADPERVVVVYVAPPGKPGPALAVRNLFHDPTPAPGADGSGFFDWVLPDGSLTDRVHPERWPLPYTPDHAAAVQAADGTDRPASPEAVRRFTYLGPVRP